MSREAKNEGCIYMWKCLVNGKSYIGQTRRGLEHRVWQHTNSASRGVQTRFYHALRKHGVNNFVVGVIEDNIPKDQLDSKEMYYIELYDTYKNGYNATPGGYSQAKFTEERRRKIGEKSKGRTLSEEAKAKISATHKGKTMSKEARDKISNTLKERGHTSGTNNHFFKPWWFEVNGYRVNVNDMTIKQYEDWQGINNGTLTIRFNKKHIGKIVTGGVFKGMRFGYQGVTE